MGVAEYVVWAVALFFAATWTLGLFLRPANRVKSNVATVLLWWLTIAFAAEGSISVFHLLWAFPLALLVPAVLLLARASR